MSEAYVRQLKNLRMPHQAARKQQPVVIVIKREGRVFPFLSTDFNKAALRVVLDVEPDSDPDSYRLVLGKKNEPTSSNEAEYLLFKGERNADRKFTRLTFKELFVSGSQWASYQHVGLELGPVVNGIVLTGKYKDDKGQEWSFSDIGKATFPDKSFYYELSLNDKKSNCEYFEAEDLEAADGIRYYGFVWKAGKLKLFNAKLSKDRVRCESRPFAELTPQ